MSVSVFKTHDTVTIAASTTSDNLQLPGVTTGIRIINSTSSVAWVQFGVDNTVVAAVPVAKTKSTAIPIAPGATEVFRRDRAYQDRWAAVVLESGSGKVIFTEGEGA